jgi:hypothetical protein
MSEYWMIGRFVLTLPTNLALETSTLDGYPSTAARCPGRHSRQLEHHWCRIVLQKGRKSHLLHWRLPLAKPQVRAAPHTS